MKGLACFSISVVACAFGIFISAVMYKIGVENGKAQVMAQINEVVAEEARKAGL